MSESNISSLIDMSDVDFNEYTKNIPNMSELYGIKRLMELEYQRVTKVKDGLLSMIKTGEYENGADYSKVSKSLNDLYSVLVTIENKCTILNNEIGRRKTT